MQSTIIKYKTIDSTNLEAARLLNELNISRQVCIVADYQESGKGQQLNKWVSAAGESILISWIIFPEFLSVKHQFQLSKAVTMAIIDFLKIFNVEGMIKWPNDILVNSHKIGGVLIENSVVGEKISHSIVGIGININQSIFPDFDLPATSLRNLTGKKYEIEVLIPFLLNKLESAYEMLHTGNVEMINNNYLNKLYKKNVDTTFRIDGKPIRGLIRGVDEYGQLLVESNNELKSFGLHEIKMTH